MNIAQVRRKLDAKTQADGREKWLWKLREVNKNLMHLAVCPKILQQ